MGWYFLVICLLCIALLPVNQANSRLDRVLDQLDQELGANRFTGDFAAKIGAGWRESNNVSSPEPVVHRPVPRSDVRLYSGKGKTAYALPEFEGAFSYFYPHFPETQSITSTQELLSFLRETVNRKQDFHSHYTIPYERRKPRYPDPKAAAIQRRLFESQFMQDCSKQLHFLNTRNGKGIGSIFLQMAAALRASMTSGRTFIIQPGRWVYAPENECPLDWHGCFFQPVTSCPAPSERPLGKEPEPWETDEPDPARPKLAEQPYKGTSTSPSVHWHMNVDLVPADRVPNPHRYFPDLFPGYKPDDNGRMYLHSDRPVFYRDGLDITKGAVYDWLWFASQAVYFLMQPKPEIVEAMFQAKANILGGVWRGPMIAMHVRHGDKHTETPVFELKEYMTYAYEMRKRTDARTIFLMTEDQAVIDQAVKEYPDWTFLYTNYPRLNISIPEGIQNGTIDAKAETYNALVNLYLALECDGFVVTFSSNWGRLLIHMHQAHYGYLPPFASLDDWSYSPEGDPSTADVNEGYEATQINDNDRAVMLLRRAIERKPDNINGLVMLGTLMWQQNNRDEAIELHKRALTKDPYRDYLHENIGMMYFATGKLREAEFHLNWAVELRPSNDHARGKLERVRARLANG